MGPDLGGDIEFFFPPFRPGMAPGGLGTPKIDHEPYIWTNFFPVSSNSIVIGPFLTHFWVRGVGGPMYVIVYPAKYNLGQVRSCNLLGRRAGQGSNKRLIQAEICLDIPPGAAYGGAPGALRALGRGDI